MDLKESNRVLDFGPIGMWWEITQSTADTGGEFFEAINVVAPGFAGPPLHIHPHAEESYEVLSGALDVCIAGKWRTLKAGESITVPAGTAHTLKNSHAEAVRLLNVHKPALGYERFFRRFHRLVGSGKLKLPAKDFVSLVLVSMLFVDHEQEIKSAKPPHMLMRVLAFIGRVLGYQLPEERSHHRVWQGC
jgi:mannose-6-phosphate isomerase-like protein (cupin superfamily)